MFQSFEERSDRTQGAKRLPLLRAELARRGVDGFVLPRTDAHQSEYLPPHDERLAWLTGFSGSAGAAVVLERRAAIFVDGRYTVQVAHQVDSALFEIVHLVETPPADWIADNLEAGDRIGFDPWLHTIDGAKKLKDGVARAGGQLVALDDNPLDAVWTDQPPPPKGAIVPHPLDFAGVDAGSKLADLRAVLSKSSANAVVLSACDTIAWLFNIRGSDIAHTPVALAFAVVTAQTATLFTDPEKISPETDAWLAPHCDIKTAESFASALDELGAAAARVRVDPASTALWIADRLVNAGATLDLAVDPCQLPKARKNPTEIEGSRIAHERDGVAVVRFARWLDENAESGKIDEIAAVRELEAQRARSNALIDVSFETIAGAGPNGAIVHYRVSEATNRRLEPGSLFLIDSGAQYPDGTTDITRTFAIGKPSAEMRRLFTLVLKGHIAVATARFPVGTTGAQLDSLARNALWRAGLDYDHGTGHGVGSYLSVHEGPQRISKRGGDVKLEPGMILSNEPGVYRPGAFGIRIENLILVTEPAPVEGGDMAMLAFETLTMAPIDRRLIDKAMLSPAEIEWIDGYHDRVLQRISPKLSVDERDWLIEATRPL